MTDELHSVRERVWNATAALAEQAEPIQKRIEWAGVELWPLLPGDFGRDDEARGVFESIKASLTSKGDIPTTASSMNDQEAVEVAKQIVHLDAMCRPLWREP